MPFEVSYAIGKILARKAAAEGETNKDLSDLIDPGGVLTTRLDQCRFCEGSGEDWGGWYRCRYCMGKMFVKIEGI